MHAANVTEPTFACRRCGERVPAGPLARQGGARVLIDRACPRCHHRALYRAAEAAATSTRT